MTYDDEIVLLTPDGSPGTDGKGDKAQTYTREPRLCEVRSVGMRETYQALAAGLRPELTFVMYDRDEYAGQRYLEYGGDRYTIVRTYSKDRKIELVAAKAERGG